jgi:hypothetical protein
MPGAGILPVAFHRNKIYFLFGRENIYNDTPGWSDFGGGMEKGESVMDTNLREIEEETCGFIQKKEIVDSIRRHGTLVFQKDKYTTTLVKIPYDEKLPFYFNKNQLLINKYIPKVVQTSVIFEKDRMTWVSMEDIDKLPYRPFYWGMIQILIANKQEIKKFLRG